MAQPGHRSGLASEAFGEGRVPAHLRRQNLQGDQPVQSRLPGLVDGPHTADPQQFENLQLRKVPGQFLCIGWLKTSGDSFGGRNVLRWPAAGTVSPALQAQLDQARRTRRIGGVGQQFGPTLRASTGFGHGDFSFTRVCFHFRRSKIAKRLQAFGGFFCTHDRSASNSVRISSSISASLATVWAISSRSRSRNRFLSRWTATFTAPSVVPNSAANSR